MMTRNNQSRIAQVASRDSVLSNWGKTMTNVAKSTLLVLLGTSLLVTAGCMADLGDRDYVQTNVVDKALFEGEW